MAIWQERFRKMENSRQRMRGHGSAAVTIEGYLYDTIRIGEVVGWIFNQEKLLSFQKMNRTPTQQVSRRKLHYVLDFSMTHPAPGWESIMGRGGATRCCESPILQA